MPGANPYGGLISLFGALLSLLAAATFALNVTTVRRGVIGGSVFQAIAVTNALGVILLAPICFVFGAFGEFASMSGEAFAWFSAAGIVHFVIGRYSVYRATRALGATQSGPIQQVSLLLSLALALIFLDESLTPLRFLGIVFILSGPVIILQQRMKRGEVRTRSGLLLNYVEGYFWGLVCAVAFGVSPLLINYGLGDGTILRGMAGGFVSYGVAATAVVLLMAIPGFRSDVLATEWSSAKFFCAAGIFVGLSQLLVFMAFSIAPVTVVQPIQRTALMFRVIFGWMINRDHEVFGVSVLIAIAMSMLGVLAVTVSAEVLIDTLNLPTGIADLLRAKWPGGGGD